MLNKENNMNEKKQIKAGVILQYLQMALQVIINLIYTPIMLKILGSVEYGIYNLSASIVSYLSLLTLGFGSSYIRFYSRYKSKNDDNGIKKMNGLYMVTFTLMGIVAFIAGGILAKNINIFYNGTYTTQNIETARWLMILLTINLAVSFPASVFVSYITSQERFIFQKLINIGTTVLSPLLNIVVLYLGYGSIGMAIVTTIISFLVDLCNAIYCLKKLNMQFCFKNLNKSLLKEIAVFSSFIALNQIIDQVNWQTDKVILGKMVNGTAVAVYAVGSNINTMYISLSTAISSVFTPKIHKIVNEKKSNMDEELTNLFIKVGRVQYFVLMLILTGFIFFGKYFISKWAGEGYELSYYVALLLICPVTIPLCQNIGIEIQRAKNKHQFRSIVYTFMAILNVIISIILCKYLNVIGVALGTTISLLVSNGLIMNIYYQKKIGIDILKFWKSILTTIPSLLIPCIIGILLMKYVKIYSIIEFIGLAILYCIIYCVSIYFIGFNNYEKDLTRKPLEKITGRKGEKTYG